MIKRTKMLGLAAGVAMSALAAGGAFAQEVTLKMHQFLPAQATVPAQVLDVWANNVEAQSDGRIKVERYAAMALGGTPPELMDQAIDGIADLVWTVVGYTPGRYRTTEVFELPFSVTDAREASCAFWQMFEEHMKDGEFADLHIVGTWVHGPGMFHTADPVETPEDLAGMKIRGGSVMVNKLLERVGATPVGMPVPAVSEALSKGVIDGTTIPWEVTYSLKVPELVTNHTEFEGPALYNLTFVLAMNKGVYDSLSDENKAVIDANSGLAFSVFAGGVMEDADAPARQVAVDLGNNIITVSEEEAQAWKAITDPIYAEWVGEMDAMGKDGQALIDQAQSLMAQCRADMASIDTYGK